MEWPAMVALGAFHGINPGMGWLFAVALGMQQGSARGVWRALPPIALGHAAAVGVVLIAAAVAQAAVPSSIRVVVAATLIALGGYRMWRHGHPRFGGMQVGFRDLTVWSFLMASAHGAGMMVVPWVLALPTDVAAAARDHSMHVVTTGAATAVDAVSAVTVHTLTYFAVMTGVAWVVYRQFGVMFLRTAWVNLDWVWAGALVLTGTAVLLT